MQILRHSVPRLNKIVRGVLVLSGYTFDIHFWEG